MSQGRGDSSSQSSRSLLPPCKLSLATRHSVVDALVGKEKFVCCFCFLLVFLTVLLESL